MSGHSMADVPRLTLRGFSNVDLAVHEESQPTTFALGQVDLFYTSAHHAGEGDCVVILPDVFQQRGFESRID